MLKYHLRTNLENTDIECQRGGQPWFLIFWHYITFNWHNFFVFHWNWNSLKWSVQHGRNWHPADFWTFRPPHRPEISVCQKKCIFPPLGHLPSPFIFFDNGLAKKKIFFCLRYEHMYLENIPLKWCYFVIWLKMEKNPQLRFPNNEIFMKKNFGHFLLLFLAQILILCTQFPISQKLIKTILW